MVFLKFGDNENNLTNFVENGEVFINHAEFFRKTDNHSNLFDLHELSDSYHQNEGAKINIAGRDFSISAPFSMRYEADPVTHIFCMYNIDLTLAHNESHVFDPRLWGDFGEYVVLIHKPVEFISRLLKKLNAEGLYKIEYDEVKYFDEKNYEGETGTFKKRSSYSYQREFRFAVKESSHIGKAIKLSIGCINDIAFGPVHKSLSKNRVQNNQALI